MSDPVLPPADEAARYVPDEASITWRRASDARGFAGAGYALLLQVMHPTIGAGVSEHSDFRADPWGRLLRTLDFVNVSVYGGPEASAEMCRRVREMHKHIKGTKPDGSRYHALEPEAYAWVHATLAEAIITANDYFGRGFDDDQKQRLWSEWKRLGRLLGVRERDLPDSWGGFRHYFDRMVSEQLEATDAAREVLETLSEPTDPPPFLPPALARVWGLAGTPLARVIGLATIGLLPPLLRERLGLEWTRAQDRELRAIGVASRALTPLMPESLRIMGPTHLRWRREAIARGDVAAPSRAPGSTRAPGGAPGSGALAAQP